MSMIALAALLLAAADAPPPAPLPRLEFVLEEMVLLGPSVKVGATPYGGRNIVPIIGGTFAGPGIKGVVVPGGWDWQLATTGGCMKLKADYMIRTDDGVTINVVNQGMLCDGPNGGDGFTSPVFEAPLGRYQWLNAGGYVGTVTGATVDGKPAVRIRFYRARAPN